MPPIWAIVPAAGSGSRMQANRPKQYLQIMGKTILEHTLMALCRHPAIAGVMLVADLEDPHCPDLQQVLGKPICKTQGGHTRAQSVCNGLEMLMAMQLAPDTLVAVHDAARPCLNQKDLSAVLQAAQVHADKNTAEIGAILALPLRETIKRARVDSNQALIEQTLDRSKLWAAQTPQVFPLEILLDALQKCPDATDEAQAMERAGYQVRLVSGSASNIKITVAEDLALAQFWLQAMRS